MHGIRHLAAVALALAGGLSGCSVYADMTTSDFAQRDGAAIVAAASTAMQDVTSMRLTGQVRSRGEQVFVDLKMARDGRCTGSIRVSGNDVDIRRVGDRAWIRGPSAALQRLSSTPLPDGVRTSADGSWVPTSDKTVITLCDLESFLARLKVVDYGTNREKGKLGGGVPATVGDESEQDSQDVVELTGSPGGLYEERSVVRSQAPHYVVRIESSSAQDGAAISFSEFNDDIEVERPPARDLFRR